MERLARQNVYLDTDILVNCVYPALPHAEACRQAVQNLISNDGCVYFSPVSTLEYAQAFRSLATRGIASHSLKVEFNLHRWHEQAVRQQWMLFWRDELERLLSSVPDNTELPLTPDITRGCFALMARYALRSQDATHLATALHYEIPVFWTCDDHFQRVEDLAVEIIRDPA